MLYLDFDSVTLFRTVFLDFDLCLACGLKYLDCGPSVAFGVLASSLQLSQPVNWDVTVWAPFVFARTSAFVLCLDPRPALFSALLPMFATCLPHLASCISFNNVLLWSSSKTICYSQTFVCTYRAWPWPTPWPPIIQRYACDTIHTL